MQKLRTLLLISSALLVALTYSTDGTAQKMKYKLADKYEQRFEFEKAAEIYEDVLKKRPQDPIALRAAADCRVKIDDLEKAETHYRVLSKLKTATDKDLLHFAAVLKANKKYDAAVVVYERYLQNNSDPFLEGYTKVDWAEEIVRDSARYEVLTTGINSPQSDFGPSFGPNNTLVFSSARREGKGKRRTYSWTDQSYLNLYSATIAPDSSLTDAKVFKDKTNSRFHEGTYSVDTQQGIVYFTRNNYYDGKKAKDDDGYLNLGIFMAEKVDGEVGKIRPFPFNDASYSIGHPAISPDGKKIYFVSDMPGGFGGADIYVSERNLDFWSLPKNLGPKINTPGDEMFPYADEVGNLYFASDWHPGIGGLDLFYTQPDDPESEVLNFGYPVNSSGDDFGIILYEDGFRGYFSSNRIGGLGDDDIYQFIIHPPEFVTISGRITDLISGTPIPNARILLRDSLSGTRLEEVAISNEDGRYLFEVPINRSYSILGMKEGYVQNEIEVFSNPRSAFIDGADIQMQATDFASEGIVLYAKSESPATGTMVYLKTKENRILQEVQVTEDGRYFFGLEPNSVYIIEAMKEGFPPQQITIETTEIPSIINSDLRLFKFEKGAVVRLDNIYYDYNKASIRKDAMRELDRLVFFMKDRPGLRIEISAHTDSRGTDTYNQRLSQRRAESVFDYMVSEGIDPSRIEAKGYGESLLLNDCGNNVECSEEAHQRNRRTEFKILDI